MTGTPATIRRTGLGRHPLVVDDLPAERGSRCGCGGAEVLGRMDEAPLGGLHAVGDGAPVAEAGEVERPDVHGRFEPVELVVGRLDVPAVGVDGGIDALPVGPTGVPQTGAPDQISEVGQARPAPDDFQLIATGPSSLRMA